MQDHRPSPVAHPPGLYLLFVTEMWERFSFYGMKAFLILYMTLAASVGGLEWSTQRAGAVYGWYAGLVYLTPILGGYLADRALGTHWSMIIGGIIIAAGHFTLAAMDLAPHGSTQHLATFFAGLGLIIVGTGFFKPCVSVMVGQLYGERDPRRDAAFTIFYMGINLGAFLGPLVCGALRLAQRTEAGTFGWPWAFGAAGVGMLLGLLCYALGRPFLLKGIGLPLPRHDPARSTIDEDLPCPTCGRNLRGLPTDAPACPQCGTRAPYVPPHRRPLTHAERQRVALIFIMAFFVIFFWTAFEQAGGSMNLFAEQRVDRTIAHATAEALYRFGHEANYAVPWWVLCSAGAAFVLGWILLDVRPNAPGRRSAALGGAAKVVGLGGGLALLVVGAMKGAGFLGGLFPDSLLTDPYYPTEWFQSVNPFCILVMAPLFAGIWLRLARRGMEPSTPVKFALGLLLLGAGFLFMVAGASASERGGQIVRVSGFYLLAAYCVHTMGELCLSPVGLSMITRLSPVRLVSFLMGVWFLANFVANLAAGYLTGYSERVAQTGFILPGLAGFFLVFVIAPVAAGFILLALSPVLKRMTHGRG